MQSVRIHNEDHKVLKDLSGQTNRPMADLMGDAIAALHHHFVLEATNQAYAGLRKNKKAWVTELAEREAWENASIADADKEEWK